MPCQGSSQMSRALGEILLWHSQGSLIVTCDITHPEERALGVVSEGRGKLQAAHASSSGTPASSTPPRLGGIAHPRGPLDRSHAAGPGQLTKAHNKEPGSRSTLCWLNSCLSGSCSLHLSGQNGKCWLVQVCPPHHPPHHRGRVQSSSVHRA